MKGKTIYVCTEEQRGAKNATSIMNSAKWRQKKNVNIYQSRTLHFGIYYGRATQRNFIGTEYNKVTNKTTQNSTVTISFATKQHIISNIVRKNLRIKKKSAQCMSHAPIPVTKQQETYIFLERVENHGAERASVRRRERERERKRGEEGQSMKLFQTISAAVLFLINVFLVQKIENVISARLQTQHQVIDLLVSNSQFAIVIFGVLCVCVFSISFTLNWKSVCKPIESQVSQVSSVQRIE